MLLGRSWQLLCGSLVKEEENEPEPLHPYQNPVLQSYLLPHVHGTYRRYVLELLVVAGLLLPWVGPAFGLAVMTPIVLLTVENGKIITTERDCFGGGDALVTCPTTSYFDYYFWNITNPAQFLAGTQPPALKEIGPYTFLVQESRWNVTFSSDFATVNYSYLNFQTFVPEQSCSGCSLDNDYLVTINRGYLAFLSSPAIDYNDAFAFIPAVPVAMRQIVAGIEAALITAGFPPGFAPAAAVSQWGRAAFGYPAQLTGSEDPTNPGFANWVHVYQGFTYAAASAVLTDSQADTLLTMFKGNPSLDTPAGYDGASNVILFAFYPAASVIAILNAYYPTLGLGTGQVQLLQGYLYWVCQNFIVPSALYGGPIGQPLDPTAGGLLVKRTIRQWIDGWQDPLIKQNVSLGFAWPANDTASRTFGVPTTWLTHEDSPLIFEYSLNTGTVRDKQPYNVIAFNGHDSVVAYPDTPLPYGTIAMRGSAGGLSFPLNVRRKSTFTMLDGIFNRPLNVSFTGREGANQGVKAWFFGLNGSEVAGCNGSALSERCAYPDSVDYTFNASLTYSCPTLLSLPHFYKAAAVLPASTGFDFDPDPSQHDWTFSIEPVSGYATTGAKGYQLNHLVRRSSFLYPSLWQNASAGTNGMWLPTFWVRSRFEPTPDGAKALRSGLALRSSFRIYPAYLVPPIFIFLMVVAGIFLALTPGAKAAMRSCETARKSRARPFMLTSEEVALVAHIPADDKGDTAPAAKSSIRALEEAFAEYWDASDASELDSSRSSEFTPREYSPATHDSSVLWGEPHPRG